MQNLTIKQKLYTGFIFIGIITVITSIFSIYFISKVGYYGTQLGVKEAPLGDAAMEIKLTATTAHLWFEEIISGDSSNDVQNVWDLLDETLWYCDAIIKGNKNDEGTFYKTDDENIRKKVKGVKLQVIKFIAIAHQRYDNYKNNIGNNAAGSDIDQKFDIIFDTFIEEADQGEEMIHDFMDNSNKNLIDTSSFAQSTMIIIAIIAIVISILLAWLIIKSIINQLGGTMKDITNIVTNVSNGNLNVKFKNQGNNKGLMKLMEKMTIDLTKLISNIFLVSKALQDASYQLSSVSQQISQSAGEQASTTEEISSSMEQMLAMISSNIQNASITGKSAEKSASEMKQSNEFFIQMINSVSEIIEKISIITEIAGKTDILSINAAIEAARAGETGKGFAVVAYEIRKLADKTKMAAEEISELSGKGQNVSKIAGDKLAKTIPDIIKSAELVKHIVAAGKEQQSGVENINNSIQQLTEITSQNSASAEEMSVSAEELTAQAEQLKELISVFKIADKKEAATERKEDKEEKLTKTTNQKEKIVLEQKTENINIDLSSNDDKDDEFEKY